MTKRLFISVFTLFLMGVSTMTAEEIKRDGQVFKAVSKSASQKAEPIATPYKYEDTKGESYPIYLSANGRAYVIKVSAKSGKEYKKYLGEEISREICREMGKEYKELKK